MDQGADPVERSSVKPEIIWGPFITCILSVIILVTYSCVAALVSIYHIAVKYGVTLTEVLEDKALLLLIDGGDAITLSLWSGAPIGVLLTILAVWIKKGSKINTYLGLNLSDPKIIFKWLGFMVLLIILLDAMTISTGRPLVPPILGEMMNTSTSKLLLFSAMIFAAPVFEEFLFRGFLFKSLRLTWLKTNGTIVVTSILWAIIHFQYDAFSVFLVFVLGLMLGAARAKSGSVPLCIVMHMVANTIASTETFYIYG